MCIRSCALCAHTTHTRGRSMQLKEKNENTHQTIFNKSNIFELQ